MRDVYVHLRVAVYVYSHFVRNGVCVAINSSLRTRLRLENRKEVLKYYRTAGRSLPKLRSKINSLP